MLDLLPVGAIGGSAESPIFCTFADIARQFDALGVAKPTSLGREDDRFTFRRGITSLMIPDPVGSFALMPAWEAINGFPVTAIDRAMQASIGPGSVVVLEGQFDPDRVAATLSAHGFTPADVAGTDVLHLVDDAWDLFDPFPGLWLGAGRYVAIVDDGRLIYASDVDAMAGITDLINGTATPATADESFTALFLDDLEMPVSGQLVGHSGLDVTILNEGAANPIPAGFGENALPPVDLAFFGTTAGDRPHVRDDDEELPFPDATVGQSQIRLLFADASAAETAADMIDWRARNGTTSDPYVSWEAAVGAVSVSVEGEDGLVLVTFDERDVVTRVVYHLLDEGNLGLISYP